MCALTPNKDAQILYADIFHLKFDPKKMVLVSINYYIFYYYSKIVLIELSPHNWSK